jgi:hypothetical protein
MQTESPMRMLFLAVSLAALVFGACSKRHASEERAARADSAVVATSTSSTPIVVRAAGVRFDPPSTWPRKNYRVESKSGPLAEEEQDGAAHDVTMHYQPDQPGHKEAPLCRIVVFPRHEWARVDTEDGPPVGTVIDSLHAWVYVAQMPQSNPYPDGSPDAEQFDAMRLSIRELRARFAIEGDGPDANARDAGDL